MIKRKIQDYIVYSHGMVENAKSVGFSFLATKTMCVHFCRKRRLYPTLIINGVWMQCKTDFKFVVQTFNRHLTWKSRVDYLAAK